MTAGLDLVFVLYHGMCRFGVRCKIGVVWSRVWLVIYGLMLDSMMFLRRSCIYIPGCISLA